MGKIEAIVENAEREDCEVQKVHKIGTKNTNVEYTEKFHKLLPFNARIEIRSIRTIEKFILYRSFLSM